MRHEDTRPEQLIRQRVNALARLLPGAREGDVHLLHQARVATRRLREALPLVTAGSRGRKLRRAVRRVTRMLGPVRELDVTLLTLDDLSAAAAAPAGAIARLRQVVRQERDRLHKEVSQKLGSIDMNKWRRRAAAATRKGTNGVADRERLASARSRAARRAAALREAIENAAGIYLPDRLHAVRIGVKKLRYAMELTRELSGSRATARIRTLKEAQELLGRMHDVEVLITRVRAVQGSSGAPNLRLSGDLDRLVRHLETECRQIHGQYMAARRKLLVVCDHAATSQPSADGRAAGVSAA
jgi:CHAD domain-containing protein